jgi:hypothetical protein
MGGKTVVNFKLHKFVETEERHQNSYSEWLVP